MDNKAGILLYIKNFKFNSLFIKNSLIIILMVVLPFSVLTAFVYNFFNKIMLDEIKLSANNELSRVKDSMDMIFNEADNITLKVSQNANVQFFSYNNDFTEDEYFELYKKISATLEDSINASWIDNILIYSEINDKIIGSNGSPSFENYLDKNWYSGYLKKRSIFNNWVVGRIENSAPVLKMVTFFRNIDSEEPEYGTVILNIDMSKLGYVLGKDNNTNIDKVYIADQEGKIIFDNNYEMLNKRINEIEWLKGFDFENEKFKIQKDTNNSDVIITSTQMSYRGFNIVAVSPMQFYEEKMNQLKNILVIVISLSLVIALIASFIISVKVFQPVKSILSTIEERENLLEVKNYSGVNKLNELKIILNSITKSYDANIELESELKKRFRLLKKSQAAALQSQINPHFLYNTLDTINWMSIGLLKGNNPVSEMISNLSKLLRLSMETEENLITISEELKSAKLYLDIQMVRYSDMLKVDWNMDPEILDNKIVKLSLQPLIENSIYHGIKQKKDEGTIKISGFKSEDRIYIEVEDDGVGMTEEEVDRMNDILKEETVNFDEHIGIRSINLRLRLIFGEEYGLKVDSILNKGTKVIIMLPII